MRAVYQYGLAPIFSQCLTLRKGAKVLNVQNQNESIALWVLEDTQEVDCERHFWIVGNGENIDFNESESKFLGTVLLNNGQESFHVFESFPPEG